VEFSRLDSNAKLPTRATKGSAGYDLYALHDGVIQVGETVTVPTGVTVVDMPNCIAGEIWPRSGMARKDCIDRMAGLIDSDYAHGIGVVLINHGSEPYRYASGDRVGQIKFGPAYFVDNDFVVSEQRNGGFGSSGK